jgi:hypothetical protein
MMNYEPLSSVHAYRRMAKPRHAGGLDPSGGSSGRNRSAVAAVDGLEQAARIVESFPHEVNDEEVLQLLAEIAEAISDRAIGN